MISKNKIIIVADFLANALEHHDSESEAISYMEDIIGLGTHQARNLLEEWKRLEAKERMKLTFDNQKFYAWISEHLKQG